MAYRQCASSRSREVKLATLSEELASGVTGLRMYEELQGVEKSGLKSATSAFYGDRKIDINRLRNELAQKFQGYRNAGGTAARLDDVKALPNPCAKPG